MIKKSIVSLLMLLILCSLNVFAEDDKSLSDYKRLIEDFYNLHINETAGVSVVVLNDQGVIYKGSYGYLDLEKKRGVDDHSVFEWGSVSKLLVWTSVMQLYENHILDLKASIHQYLPDDFIKAIQINEEITLLDLMNHRSGFQETEYPYEYTAEEQLTSLKEALIKTCPKQIYPVNTVTAYSNYGTALAAYIVAYVSDMDYSDYVKKHILEPLEMNDTAVKADLSDQIDVKERRAEVQTYAFQNQEKIELGNNIAYIDLYPVGSVTGTIDDLQKFVQVFIDESQYTKLFKSRSTLDEMLSPSFYYSNSDIPRNYHGFWTLYYDQPIICHGGNTNGFSSNVMIDLENKLAYVVMTNVAGEMTYNFLLPSLIFGTDMISNSENSLNLDGFYTSARTIVKGPKTYLSYLMTSEMKKENNVYSWQNHGQLKPVGDGLYLFENADNMRYLVKAVLSDGKIKLEGFTSDYIETDPIKYWISKFLIGAMIVSIIVTLLEGILLIVKKIYRSNRGPQVIIKMILLLELVFFVYTNNTFNQVLSIAYSMMLMMTALALMIFSWKHMKKEGMKGFTNYLYVLLDMLPIGTMLHFQLFVFW